MKRVDRGPNAGANIPCLYARTCLQIKNPCLKVGKSVLLTMFNHYCDIRVSMSNVKVGKIDAHSRHFTARCYAERGYAKVCRLSVHPSVRDVQPSGRVLLSDVEILRK